MYISSAFMHILVFVLVFDWHFIWEKKMYIAAVTLASSTGTTGAGENRTGICGV